MDSYCKGLSQKLLKLESLLILTQQLRETADNADLIRIDHLMNERQVLMDGIDALDSELSQVDRPDQGSGHYRITAKEAKASELFDTIKRIIDQIRNIDDNALEVLNQSKNAVQRQILTLHQERKDNRHSKFLNIKT